VLAAGLRLGLGSLALATFVACGTVALPPTGAVEFKGRGTPLSSILAHGAERVSSQQLRTMLVPGQTIESNPHGLPRFKVELHQGGQYSGTLQRADGTSYYNTGTWWVEDSGRFCLMYRGEGAYAPAAECAFLYALNGRYFASSKNEPDEPALTRIFGKPF